MRDGLRAALYVDGFNFYHAINNLDRNHLKWISYDTLGRRLAKEAGHRLVGVVYCTAYYTGDERKKWRHQQLVGAQQVHGVEVVKGHFIDDSAECRACGNVQGFKTEKEGDINVAIHIMRDAFQDKIDHAYLLSADSDQVATVRMFCGQFPRKTMTSIIPPGRKPSAHINAALGKKPIILTEPMLEWCVMPQIVTAPRKGSFRRPHEYAPRDGWVHPAERGRK